VVRAKEIAINQASGPSSSDSSRLGVAEEVTQMIQQAINVANRRIGDRYLFGGFKTNKPPVDSEGRYQGDRGQMMVEISQGVFMTTNLPGIEIFNSRPESSEDEFRLRGSDPRKQEETVRNRDLASLENPDHGTVNTNLFEELQNLRIGLLTGNLEGIRDTLERFDGIHANIVANRAKIGSRVQGLETAAESASRQTITNASLTQSLEDADMTQVVSDLAREETVFRSALSGAQKLLQPTLMDFLK
jgi:flagellar hook-associated protein 3 FlgL